MLSPHSDCTDVAFFKKLFFCIRLLRQFCLHRCFFLQEVVFFMGSLRQWPAQITESVEKCLCHRSSSVCRIRRIVKIRVVATWSGVNVNSRCKSVPLSSHSIFGLSESPTKVDQWLTCCSESSRVRSLPPEFMHFSSVFLSLVSTSF